MDNINIYFQDVRLLEEINRVARLKIIPQDAIMQAPGDEIVFLPIVQTGVLRIVRQNEEGKEIFLYHLFPGQTCAVSIICCQGQKKSSIKAVAEEESEILLIPIKVIDDWFKYPEWKTFINNTYGTRIAELLEVIDLIAFSNMDKQLLHYLQQRCKALNSNALYITHQQIADELHTHREAISRLLRNMEEKNILKLSRNTIEFL